ncbi:gamma aminobutyric acid receptor subunit [Brachionus plicatilis]|uniref:Gamma aminobutyric acid receptor subunit n=1 Tax=Brachionus plicatilis TaxID=10195 RepID=A0A3M7QD39_BRAPC|nr:gamma aminobutyric acid receptor subunit [Brachionus plicatilis]
MNRKPHQVETRVIFLRIGDIETVNEKFFAEILVESRWEESKLSSEFDKSYLFNEEKELASAKKYWNPNIYIENALNDVKKTVSYKIMKRFCAKHDEPEDSNLKFWLYECQQIKGHFFQKLKLKYFPLDVQDLSIMVTTFKSNKEVELVKNKEKASVIGSSMTIDKNIWHLHPNVDVKGNSDLIADKNILIDQNQIHEDTSLSIHSLIKFPFIMFQCKVSRRGAAIFAVFAVNPNQPYYRLPISATLLLTSITFRWSYSSRCLPTVNYFTSLDSYSIKSIVLIFLCLIWHVNLSLLFWLRSAFKIRKSIRSSEKSLFANLKSRFSQSDDMLRYNMSLQLDDMQARNSIFSVVNNIDLMSTLNENNNILRRYSQAVPFKGSIPE